MRYAKWMVLAVMVLAAGLLLLPGHLGLPPLVSGRLIAQEVGTGEPGSPFENWVVPKLVEVRGAKPIAGFGMYAQPTGSRIYTLRTELWHDESYRIESMRLTFWIPLGGEQLALVTPEGNPWNDPHFARNAGDGSISFSVDHLGSMGMGTVFNEFVLEQRTQAIGETSTFRVQATFTLRSNDFIQLKQKKADDEIEVALPVQSAASTAAALADSH